MLNNYKYLKQLVEVAIKIICSVQALLFSVQVLVLFLFGSTQKLTNNRYSVKILTDYWCCVLDPCLLVWIYVFRL